MSEVAALNASIHCDYLVQPDNMQSAIMPSAKRLKPDDAPSNESSSITQNAIISIEDSISSNNNQHINIPVVPLLIQERQLSSDSDITFRVYTNANTNDINVNVNGSSISTTDESETSMALITLKNIFSRQLPKMPKEYIVRLVFDQRHYSLAILRKSRIIGGICYRAYFDQRFGEIAFCAINGTEQVKGYGTILMNELKTHVQKQENGKLDYFLTYADNFAIGYFQKQGFTKTLSMPKERWVGFIKDYDGGTLMECYIHPNMDYLNVSGIVSKQRAYILARIKQYSQSHVVYSGADLFGEGGRLASALESPGVVAAGWTSQMITPKGAATERDRQHSQNKLAQNLKAAVDRVRCSPNAWAFEKLPEPTDKEFEQYYALIKDPIDLNVISQRLRANNYYRCREMLLTDLLLMVSNLKSFYSSNINVSSNMFNHIMAAENVEKLVVEIFKELEEADKSTNK